MPHDPEQKRLAGEKGRTHGIYSIQARGEAAMTPDQRQILREIEEQLETPEGVYEALRERVAMSLMVIHVLESYLEEQVMAGATPDNIKIFKSWPAFQNSTVRALTQLIGTMPKPERDTLAEEILRIQELVKNAERQENETIVESPDD